MGQRLALRFDQEKIMRRILRKTVNRELDSLGNISTLANPEAVQAIVTSYSMNCFLGPVI